MWDNRQQSEATYDIYMQHGGLLNTSLSEERNRSIYHKIIYVN